MENTTLELLEKQNQNLREALTQVLYQNEMLLNWVNGAVVKVDREGMVLDANDIALHYLGYEHEELLGKQYHDTFHHTLEDGSEYPWDFCPVFAAIEDGSSHHVTGDVFWKSDGSSFSADYIVSPVRDEQNNISGATLIFRNLTEQSLQQAKKIHGMKLESIGELSAGIAHEINTPIQFIGSNIAFLSDAFTDMNDTVVAYRELLERVKDNPELAEIIANIERVEEDTDIEYLEEEVPKAIDQTSHGVERVSQLVLGLKGFAHSADNQEKEKADINQIINNTLVVCRNAYKYVANLEKRLGEIPEIRVHHGDIGQVVLNIVVNAAQAVEENRENPNDMGTITVISECDDQYVTIKISDTGGGIPQKVSERIFDPFFTTKEVGRGSGQGLAIARNIIHEKHGGELTVESQEGKGSTFIVKLPLESA